MIPSRPRRSAPLLLGLALLLAGLAGMAALITVTYGDSPAQQAWALRLGLTFSLLISAAFQVMVLVGGWLLWRAGR